MKAKAIVSANAAYFISFTWRAARQKCAAVIKIYEAPICLLRRHLHKRIKGTCSTAKSVGHGDSSA